MISKRILKVKSKQNVIFSLKETKYLEIVLKKYNKSLFLLDTLCLI